MSMLISASASVLKMRAASPTLSGTATTVILASVRSCETPEMMGCSILLSSDTLGTSTTRARRAASTVSGSATQVPTLVLNDDRTWIGIW
jgi:hypothetical protein